MSDEPTYDSTRVRLEAECKNESLSENDAFLQLLSQFPEELKADDFQLFGKSYTPTPYVYEELLFDGNLHLIDMLVDHCDSHTHVFFPKLIIELSEMCRFEILKELLNKEWINVSSLLAKMVSSSLYLDADPEILALSTKIFASEAETKRLSECFLANQKHLSDFDEDFFYYLYVRGCTDPQFLEAYVSYICDTQRDLDNLEELAAAGAILSREHAGQCMANISTQQMISCHHNKQIDLVKISDYALCACCSRDDLTLHTLHELLQVSAHHDREHSFILQEVLAHERLLSNTSIPEFHDFLKNVNFEESAILDALHQELDVKYDSAEIRTFFPLLSSISSVSSVSSSSISDIIQCTIAGGLTPDALELLQEIYFRFDTDKTSYSDEFIFDTDKENALLAEHLLVWKTCREANARECCHEVVGSEMMMKALHLKMIKATSIDDIKDALQQYNDLPEKQKNHRM